MSVLKYFNYNNNKDKKLIKINDSFDKNNNINVKFIELTSKSIKIKAFIGIFLFYIGLLFFAYNLFKGNILGLFIPNKLSFDRTILGILSFIIPISGLLIYWYSCFLKWWRHG